jgi:hypothetical protein
MNVDTNPNAENRRVMRSAAVLALLLLALMAASVVHAVQIRGGDDHLSEIELEEASEIEQAHNLWQFSPLVRLMANDRFSFKHPTVCACLVTFRSSAAGILNVVRVTIL